MLKRRLVLIALVLLVSTTAIAAPKSAIPPLDLRRKALRDLMVEQWEYTLRRNPEQASQLGDRRYNDRWTDASEKAALRDVLVAKSYLRRLEQIDPAGMDDQETLNRRLLIRQLHDAVDESQLKPWRMPVTQFQGLHIDAPQLVSVLPFETVKDYDDYVKRLRALPLVFDQTIANMHLGMADQLMPPRILLAKVVKQSEELATQKAEESPFAEPVAKFPDVIPAADQTRIRAATLGAIEQSVLPAYAKFTRFLKEEYAPHGRTDVGIWAVPGGAERYRFAVRQMTTTTLTPEEIHATGLAEVERLQKAMLAIAKKAGFDDVASFNKSLAANASLKTTSREDVLARYRKFTDEMYPKLPQLFGRLPKATMTVMPVEAFREKEAAGAQYVPGTPDGSRPGHILVNTSTFGGSGVAIEATAYHEGIPGHHLQGAIAQELPSLPPFRQQAYFGAFVEGWALYAEALAKEAGGYADPYNDYGRLQSENFRAIRLVVDTGIHAKKWTREQAIRFLLDHSVASEQRAATEIERYIAWPAQALSYKTGQLAISALRQRAEKELGPKFDVRSFHDVLLGGGALPLDVLSERIDLWIASMKKS